jgi:hypothetical protein
VNALSLNIQTPNGLLEISTKVTKDKVIEALGYEPANETHVKDNTVHITSEERENWNNKFDGTYFDLEGSPNITDDESGNLVIADSNGNAIMQVDSDGVTTTNVNTKTIALNGEDLGSRLDSLESISLPNILDNETGDLTIADENGNAIMKVDASGITTTGVSAKTLSLNGEDIGTKIDAHIDDSVSHVTSSERTTWNNKSDFSGDFNDLDNKPNITDDESGELTIVDNDGYAIVKINDSGITTTNVTAKSAVIGGTDVTVKFDELSNLIGEKSVATQITEAIEAENLDQYATDEDLITLKEELSETIVSESSEWIVADEAGNVIAKVDESGLETTTVTAKNIVVNETNVETKFSELDGVLNTHKNNTTVHITADERTDWNNKANQSDFDAHVNNGDVHFTVAERTKLSNIEAGAQVNTVLGIKGDNENSYRVGNVNITKDNIGLGNVENTSDANKPVSTAQQEALDNLEAKLSETIVSESKEWIIVDQTGTNIIARVDQNGLETTTVTAKAVVVNGTNVESVLGNIDENISNITSGKIVVGKATKDANGNVITTTYETKSDASDKLAEAKDYAKNYTDTLTDGMATTTVVDNKISAHNTSNSSHNDIRELITGLTTRLNVLANSTDEDLDQMAELVAYIKSNKSLIDGITTSKVNVSDIVDNLTTASTTKVLSANQGVVIKGLIDALQAEVDKKSDKGHTHTITANASDDDIVVLKGTNGTDGVTYSASHTTSGVTAGTYKSVTVNEYGHVTGGTNPTTLDGYGITDATSKSDFKSHTDNTTIHITSNERTTWNAKATTGYVDAAETRQQEALNAMKEELSESIVSESSEWTVVDDEGFIVARINEYGLETTAINVDSALVGETDVTTKFDELSQSINTLNADSNTTGSVAKKIADAIKAENLSQYATDSDLTAHTGNTTAHITSAERTNWNAAKTHADSNHARVDATVVEKSNTNGNIKINGSETVVYTHPSGTNPHGTTKSDVGLDNVENKSSETIRGELTKENVTKALGYTPPTSDTTYGVATSSNLGLVKSGTDITVDANGNVSVNDDSHNHVISNVDGLQGELDNKASQSDLNNLKTELSESIVSESKEWIVVDNNENIVARIDPSGLETTTVIASAVVVNGTDVESTLAGKADSSVLVNYYTKADIDNMILIAIEDIDAICGMATILPYQVISFSNNGTYDGVATLDVKLIKDKTYKVVWDDKEYISTAVCTDMHGVTSNDGQVVQMVVIGNAHWFFSEIFPTLDMDFPNTNEPFAIVYMGNESVHLNAFCYDVQGVNGSHYVGITRCDI